ncbi:MAG: phospholipase A [Opitutaceae bacterium]|jgi:outer membrane phospholipase A|nr:phospholipase A [Opitutaceae bacterium]
MKKTAIGLLLLAGAALGFGQEIVLGLLAPGEPLVAGQEAALNLVALNTADHASPHDRPETLQGELTAARGGPWPVTLRLVEAPEPASSVPARGYESLTYVFPVPTGALGRLVLTIQQPALMRAVLDVREAEASAVQPPAAGAETPGRTAPRGTAPAPATSAATPAAPAAAPGTEAVAPLVPAAPLSNLVPQPVTSKWKRSFLDNFSTHDSVYFIYGPDAPAAKFQFSFKYQMLANDGWLAKEYPLLKGLRFAYTQRSLWDIDGDSSPFYDTSYMPELFFASFAPAKKTTGPFTWIGWQAGIGHESNGRDGDSSRSLNIASARATFALGRLNGWNLILAPCVWTYIGGASDNKNIDDYRGFGELRAVFGKNDNLGISVLARAGQGFRKGSVQVDVTYPLDVFFNNFAAYLLVQYWNGHGESLLHYNKRSETIRAGLSIVR